MRKLARASNILRGQPVSDIGYEDHQRQTQYHSLDKPKPAVGYGREGIVAHVGAAWLHGVTGKLSLLVLVQGVANAKYN